MKKIFFIMFFILPIKSYASGAVAFSLSKMQYLTAINRGSKEEAIEAVFSGCKRMGYTDCELSGATHGGGYGAIAKSKKRLISSVVLGHKTQEMAQKKALEICNKNAKPCYISDSWQDTGKLIEVPAERRVGCINPRTGASDYYCTGIDVNGQQTFN